MGFFEDLYKGLFYESKYSEEQLEARKRKQELEDLPPYPDTPVQLPRIRHDFEK